MNIDTDALLDSTVLVVVGMAVVFVGLVILMVSATILVRFSQRSNNVSAREQAPAVAPSADLGMPGGEAVAAVAVALALSVWTGRDAPSRALPGGVPMPGAPAGSTWAAAGREQQMRSRGKVGHKWGRRSE